MGCRRPDTRTHRAKRLVAALLLSALPVFEPGAEGVELSLSSSVLREGQELLVEIEVDYPAAEEVSLGEPARIDKLQLVDGPTMQTIRGPGLSDQMRTLVRMAFRATTPGRVVVPAFDVAVAGQTFRTEPRLLEIHDPEIEGSALPPDPVWRVSSYRVYEGESIGVMLSLENTTEFTFPDEMTVSNPPSGLFQEVQGIGSVSRTLIDGVELLSIPIATFIFTASESGDVTIPPAEIRLGPYLRRSEAVTVAVDALPDAVTGTGAVGSYEFDAWLSAGEAEVGDSVELIMRVEGEGNLDFFRFPPVDPLDLIVIGSREESRFSPTELGYRGYRQQIIELSPQQPGAATIGVPRFAWVDPVSRTVEGAGPRVLQLSVRETGEEAPEAPRSFVLEPLAARDVLSLERGRHYDSWVSYLLLLPGPLFLLTLSIARKRSASSQAAVAVVLVSLVFLSAVSQDRLRLIEAGVRAVEEERYLEAIDRFETARVARPRSAGLFYNIAVAYNLLGEPAHAVYNLRRAVEERPLDSRFRSALGSIENSLKLEGQMEPARRLHPDAYLGLTLLFFNIAFVVAAIRSIRRGGRIILMTVFLLAAFGALVGLAYGVTVGDRLVAVVGPGPGELRRIPNTESAPWITLPAATSVEVVTRIPPLYLVRTAYGVEGWVTSDALLVEDDGE